MVISDVVAAGMIIIGVLEPVNNQQKHGKTKLHVSWVKPYFSLSCFLRSIHVEHNYYLSATYQKFLFMNFFVIFIHQQTINT